MFIKSIRSKAARWALYAGIAQILTTPTFAATVTGSLDDTGSEADSASRPDQEIVITGRRDERQSEVQRTPLAISSLEGARLEQSGITAVRELDNIVPNLIQARTVVSYVNARFFLRGVGEPDEQGEPSVPIYVDGIYIPKTLGSQSELLDIDRVEVFRGPQGQAFGHTAAGGAIVISTTVPDETPKLRATASYGNYNDWRLGLATSGPIGKDLFASLAVGYHSRDGLDRHLVTGKGVNTIDHLEGRAKLRWVPDDKLDIQLSLYGIRDRSSARGVQNLLFDDRDARNQLYPAQKFDQLTGNLKIAYDIDDHLQLQSLTGAYGWQQIVLFDNVGEFYGRGSQWVDYQDRTYQEELKLTGTYDRFQFTTGLYYYHEWWYTNRRANTAAAFVSGTTSIASSNVRSQVRYRPVYSLIKQKTDNYAWYGEGKFEPVPALTLTAGLRLNHEWHENDNTLSNLSATTATADNFVQVLFSDPTDVIWSVKPNKSWTTWQPRFSIDYKFTPDVIGYATYSRGAKSGGYEFRAQTPTAAGARQALLPINPEKVTNYEIGLKTKWLDGRVTANLTGFYLTFDDIQITTTDSNPPDGSSPITRRFNAGRGSARGVEFEGQVIPAEGLVFDLQGSYLKTRLDRYIGGANVPTVIPANAYFPNGATINSNPFVGAPLVYAPEWSGRASVTWDLPLALPGNLVVNADLNYQSESYSSGNAAITSLIPGQTFVNARLAYTTKDERWTASVTARNLFNKQYANNPGYTVDGNSGAARLPAWRTANYNDPRTVLFTIAYKR
ncbi:TonB-dependent receptor [Novosphingobium sp. PS1R-30]|uniref:TonB-dependent receptor n=1 Tax=Novosphingobium anseongense TaxID=3133436 RepID=A0ABU8RY14_9SPHN